MKDLLRALEDTIITTGGLMVLLGVSNAFGQSLTLNKIPQVFTSALMGISTDTIVLRILIVLILLIVGCFMDGSTSVVILTPLLLPIVNACGISTLEFGVIISVGLVIGTITPPFGFGLFISSSVGEVPVMSIAKKVLPFVCAAIIMTLLFMFVPQIVSLLPNLINS